MRTLPASIALIAILVGLPSDATAEGASHRLELAAHMDQEGFDLVLDDPPGDRFEVTFAGHPDLRVNRYFTEGRIPAGDDFSFTLQEMNAHFRDDPLRGTNTYLRVIASNLDDRPHTLIITVH